MQEDILFDGTGKISQTCTAATTDIITATAHGLKDGDKVQFTTSGVLPAGLSLTTDYYVIKLTADTFKVTASLGGAFVDITGTGSGTHTCVLKAKIVFCQNFVKLRLSINTSGSANMTMKFATSNMDGVPDFNAAQSKTNRWDYVGVYDQQDGSFIGGDTGLVLAGTDDNRQFKINVDGARWVYVLVTAWSAGLLRASLSMGDENI